MRLKGFRVLTRRVSLRPLDHVHRPSGGGHAHSRLAQHRVAGANPGALQMFIHVPDGLRAKAALVVILHGCGQTAAGYDEGTGWTKLADGRGFPKTCHRLWCTRGSIWVRRMIILWV